MWETLPAWLWSWSGRGAGTVGGLPELQQPMVTASKEMGPQSHSHVRVEEGPESR